VLEWLSRNKRVTWTFVAQNAQVVDYDGSRVLLGISTVGLTETFRRGAHADYVRQALIDVLGVDARVDGVPSDDAGAASSPGPSPAAPSRSGTSPWDAVPIRPATDAPPAPPRNRGAGDEGSDAGGLARDPEAAPSGGQRASTGGPGARGSGSRTPEPASWSDAPPPPGTAPSWASPLERAKAAVAEEAEVAAPQHVVDDTAISDDDESIDDLTDVGVPVVERILGGIVIAQDPS